MCQGTPVLGTGQNTEGGRPWGGITGHVHLRVIYKQVTCLRTRVLYINPYNIRITTDESNREVLTSFVKILTKDK